MMPVDLAGNRLRAGRVTKTLTADFTSGTLPSWLETQSGAGSVAGIWGVAGSGRYTCANSIGLDGNLLSLRSNNTLAPASHREMSLRLDGLRVLRTTGASQSTFGFRMGFYEPGSARGVEFQRKTNGTLWLRYNDSDTGAVQIPGDWWRAPTAMSWDFELCWQIPQKRLYLLHNDQVVGEHLTIDPATTAIRPYVQVDTSAVTEPYQMRLAQLVIDLTANT